MSTVSYSSTKAQIWNAYKALLKENKQLERQATQAQKQAARSAAKAPPAPAKAAATPAPSSDGPTDIAGVLSGLEQLQDGFRLAVGGLEDDLVREARRLADLRSAAEGLVARLENEHGIELGETTLDDLVQRAVTEGDAADTAHAERVRAHETELRSKKAAWKEEQARHAAQVSERDADRKKAVAREQAEYDYALERRRAAEADGDGMRRKAAEKALAEFEAQTRGAWSAREEAIETRETELAELTSKAEAFPGELAAAIEKARGTGAAMARKQAESDTRMRAKTMEGQTRLADERIEALEGTIATQKTRIERLGAQLEAALEQAQQLAVKALEGAANATSFKAVREIAIEQARNTKGSK